MPSNLTILLAIALVAGLQAQPASLTTSPATGFGAAVMDAAGNPYFFQTGPVTPGAAQTANGGGTCLASNGFFGFPGPCPDAYVGKLDAAGKLVFGTYLGGPTADHATALAIDPAGNVFLTGTTEGQFPTTEGAALAASTSARSFAAKLSADGSRVLYATYLPETAAAATSIAIDAQGNAYIGGKSASGHGFIVKVSQDGKAIVYSVTLAGAQQDSVLALAADSAGNVYVAGQTTSADFPVTASAVQRQLKGAQDGFAAKLDSAGRVVFATYLGGSGNDTPAAVQIDSAGNVYVAGQTTSLDFPTTEGSFEPTAVVPLWNSTGPGGFATKIAANGSSLAWSSYVMAADHYPQQGVTHMAVTAAGDAYIAGLTGAGFPVTVTAPQICYDGAVWLGDPNPITRSEHNVFVAHLDAAGALRDATYAGRVANLVRGLSLASDGSVLLLSAASGASIKSQIRFAGGVPAQPAACLSANVLNSATLANSLYGSSAAPGIVPGEAITLTGIGLGPEVGVAGQPDAQGRAPRQIAGVQVLFDGQPVPLTYVQSRQINVMAPTELATGRDITITVVHDQATIGPIQASVSNYGYAGVFRLQPGASTQAAAVNQDGSINGPNHPAARGSVVSVWGTGFGLSEGACPTGGMNPAGAANLAEPLRVFIADATPAGTPITYTPPLYAGNAPGLPCGVVQINFLVPTYTNPGIYRFFPWSAVELPGGGQSVVPSTVGASIYVK
ncbi:MAG: SBBP repeat-containing protein [Candidatus Solibacter sp.]